MSLQNIKICKFLSCSNARHHLCHFLVICYVQFSVYLFMCFQFSILTFLNFFLQTVILRNYVYFQILVLCRSLFKKMCFFKKSLHLITLYINFAESNIYFTDITFRNSSHVRLDLH